MEALRIDKKEDTYFIHLPMEITQPLSYEYKTQMDKVFLSNDFKTLVFDMQELRGINSCGIGFLVSMHSKCVNAGKRMFLLGPEAQILRTLELVQLHQFFHIINSEDELPKR